MLQKHFKQYSIAGTVFFEIPHKERKLALVLRDQICKAAPTPVTSSGRAGFTPRARAGSEAPSDFQFVRFSTPGRPGRVRSAPAGGRNSREDHSVKSPNFFRRNEKRKPVTFNMNDAGRRQRSGPRKTFNLVLGDCSPPPGFVSRLAPGRESELAFPTFSGG